MNRTTRYIGLILLTGISGLAHAATAVVDTFDAGIGTWVGNTTDTSVSFAPNGGNPDGYLATDNFAANPIQFNTIGAVNEGADYSGVFADGIWSVSVDLSFIDGNFTDAWLRYRFQDATANGWRISLGEDNFNLAWETYSIQFDTTWDDATATANGWIKEIDGTLTATPSFAALWDDVYTTEVRIAGTPFAGANGISAGIDNYIASVAPVPIPAAAWLFGTALIGFVGYSRRRKLS